MITIGFNGMAITKNDIRRASLLAYAEASNQAREETEGVKNFSISEISWALGKIEDDGYLLTFQFLRRTIGFSKHPDKTYSVHVKFAVEKDEVLDP